MDRVHSRRYCDVMSKARVSTVILPGGTAFRGCFYILIADELLEFFLAAYHKTIFVYN